MTEDKYNEIRRLVAMWYDGLTGPVQQAQLVRFFTGADTRELPDDLRAEAEVFRYMGELSQQCPDTALTADIEAAAEAEKRRSSLWRRITVWSTAVASAAVVVIAIGIAVKTSTATLDTPKAAETLPSKSVAEVSMDKNVSEYKVEETVSDDSPSPEIMNKTVMAETSVSKPKAKQSEVPEGFTEITDPETVIRVMQYVNSHSSRLITQSSDAIEMAGQSLNDTTAEAIRTAKSITF